jgi:hypothetical protein
LAYTLAMAVFQYKKNGEKKKRRVAQLFRVTFFLRSSFIETLSI